MNKNLYALIPAAFVVGIFITMAILSPRTSMRKSVETQNHAGQTLSDAYGVENPEVYLSPWSRTPIAPGQGEKAIAKCVVSSVEMGWTTEYDSCQLITLKTLRVMNEVSYYGTIQFVLPQPLKPFDTLSVGWTLVPEQMVGKKWRAVPQNPNP